MLVDPLKILLVEDNPGDVLLFKGFIKNVEGAPCELVHCGKLEEAIKLTQDSKPDIVILDLSLPDSHGLETIEKFQRAEPTTPIIVLTGQVSESVGLEAVRAGAQDYLVKGRIDGDSLIRSIRYAIERAKLLAQLREANAQIKTLSGMLPICACCKKIRDDKGYWSQVEVYVSKHTDAIFSHGYCPECAEKTMSDFLRQVGEIPKAPTQEE